MTDIMHPLSKSTAGSLKGSGPFQHHAGHSQRAPWIDGRSIKNIKYQLANNLNFSWDDRLKVCCGVGSELKNKRKCHRTYKEMFQCLSEILRNALHLMWRFSTTDSAHRAAAVFQHHGQRCSAAVREGWGGGWSRVSLSARFSFSLIISTTFTSGFPPVGYHQSHQANSVALLITACFYSELLRLDNPEDSEHEVALSSNSVLTASIDILESV